MERQFDFASAGAERDYLDLPTDIQREFGFALRFIQQGLMPSIAKTLSGLGDARVQELRADDKAGTYRTVFTVRFDDWVYILHSFQKKSKKGRSTEKADMDLVKRRLVEAKAKHDEWLSTQPRGSR